MEDIEIARNTQLEKITKIAEEMNIQEDQLEQYGKYKAKISNDYYKEIKNRKNDVLLLSKPQFMVSILPQAIALREAEKNNS